MDEKEFSKKIIINNNNIGIEIKIQENINIIKNIIQYKKTENEDDDLY